MMRLVCIITICLLLVGCSGSKSRPSVETVSTVSTETETSVETVSADGGQESHSRRGSEESKSKPAIELSNSDSPGSSMEETANKPVAGKQTKMHLTTGTERIWQNGPTPEEVARATTVKEAPPISYDKIGNGAPMLDPHADLSEIRR